MDLLLAFSPSASTSLGSFGLNSESFRKTWHRSPYVLLQFPLPMVALTSKLVLEVSLCDYVALIMLLPIKATLLLFDPVRTIAHL